MALTGARAFLVAPRGGESVPCGGEGGSAHAAEVEEGGVWGCRWVEEWGMMDGKALGVAAVPGLPRTGRWAGCEAATAVRQVVLGDMLAKKVTCQSFSAPQDVRQWRWRAGRGAAGVVLVVSGLVREFGRTGGAQAGAPRG